MVQSLNEAIELSIVLPCLNEVQTLPICIQKAREAIAKLHLKGEIIVADNGSTDGSQELAVALGARVIQVPVRGYGAALTWGIRYARGEYIAIGDADDSYDFREAVPMVEKLMLGYQMVVGTRLKGEIYPGAMPWKNRYLGTPILTQIVNLLYGASFSDVNCGMRAFSKRAFLDMYVESFGMEFASEMLVKASVLRLKTTEVPITLYRDGRNRPPHLQPWSDGWRHLKYILLFAPRFIYGLPGGILLAIGIILASLLNLTPGGQSVYVGSFWFNDHWIVVAALCCLLGYELLLTGFLAHLYTLTHRIRRRSRWMDFLVKTIKIEQILLFSFVTLAIGVGFEFSVIESWIDGQFGPLNAIRPAVTGMILILMSTQTLFSGLFYAVLSDKYKHRSMFKLEPIKTSQKFPVSHK
ncbi:glycosyltransferase family 2 protein [Oscillatoriales cyanobacterium LEGE 11467]|uniref:Glycosyltransferase family 2 protein n=1 Tax=Zarconia navalis LEGE 11467 TaxID=1828826 RepID=A0A928VWE2_9CYAN|nr:glycosyltransferase family 2 protein [Zarconia navalis]MBE9041376.1 glycosyltransferase family 2 protein [Zarconia navalis LEGE 11467]